MKTYTQEDINEYYEDELEDIICPLCQDRGYRVQLGPKILMPNEPRPADYENWLQCPTCYEVIPIYEIEPEPTVKNVIETTDNPFDNKTIIESLPNRTSKKGKKSSPKRRRNKIKLDDDKEIDTLLRIYGDRVNVLK